MEDPRGNTTHFTYDQMNRVALVLHEDGTTVSHIYDANGTS